MADMNDPTERAAFLERLKEVAREVSTWPAWKQNIFGNDVERDLIAARNAERAKYSSEEELG